MLHCYTECFAAAEKERGVGLDKTCSDPLTLSHLQAIPFHSFKARIALLVAQFILGKVEERETEQVLGSQMNTGFYWGRTSW